MAGISQQSISMTAPLTLANCCSPFLCNHAAGFLQVKHLERKTGEDVPYSDVARYLQDKLHSSSSSTRLTTSILTSSGSLLRGLGLRLDMRGANNAHVEGNSDDEEDSRTRRRRR